MNTPAPFKVTHLDFFDSDPILRGDYCQAKAFREAWKTACDERASKKLRARLRWHMRYHAREAVKRTRQIVATREASRARTRELLTRAA